MPPVQALADHCQTAADVRRAASMVLRRRREMAGQVGARFGRRFEDRVEPELKPPVIIPEPEKAVITLAPGLSLHGWVDGRFALIHFVPLPQSSTVRDIQRAVAEAADIRVQDIEAPQRTATVVLARHIAIMLCRMLTNRSLPDIGRRFGGRDHTTVLHALEKMQPVTDAIRDQAGKIPLRELVALAYRTYWEIKPKSPRRGRRVPINM